MKRKAFTLIELLVVIAIIAILAAILFPVFAQAREKARQIACSSNLKQIGLGIIQYQQDYDEVYPQGMDDQWHNCWPTTVQPYIKSIAVFRCPDDSSNQTNQVGGWEGTAISYGSNGFVAWNSVAKENQMMGVIGCGGPGASWIANNTKTEALVTNPADSIMVGEKHSDDAQAFSGANGGVGAGDFPNSMFLYLNGGFGWDSWIGSPVDIPDGSIAAAGGGVNPTYGTGTNGAVSVSHAGKTVANFLFIDGHVKSLHPAATNPDPNGNLDSNDGQSLDNMWDADRQ